MLPRVLETEAMDTPDEAADYDSMDHHEVNRVFVDDLLAAGPQPDGEILDLGTGTALIPLALCGREPAARVTAVDVARHMIALAEKNVRRAGLEDRIRLECIDAKGLPFDDGRFAAVMSNSIVHHIPNPLDVLREAWRVTVPGGLLFIRDLMRPEDDATVRRLVDTYTVGANEHQRQMFDDSLRAALSVKEMCELTTQLSDRPGKVLATTDRHWTWVAKKT